MIENKDYFSIGTISKVTGFTADQLRIWERRYGKPISERLDSGHRRYSRDEIRRLMLVRQALDAGHRPNKVVPLDESALSKLLGQRKRERIGSIEQQPSPIREWIKAAQALKDDFLYEAFEKEWRRLGSPAFFIDRALPLMKALGEGWQQGEVCVAEEHVGSETLGDFLSVLWRQFNRGNSGPAVIITTLPGNYHRNAILMIAVMSAMAGKKVIYLGPATPLEEIKVAVHRAKAESVFLSAALLPEKEAHQLVGTLRNKLAQHINLVVGGLGEGKVPNGVLSFQDMMSFYHWLHSPREMDSSLTAGFTK